MKISNIIESKHDALGRLSHDFILWTT